MESKLKLIISATLYNHVACFGQPLRQLYETEWLTWLHVTQGFSDKHLGHFVISDSKLYCKKAGYKTIMLMVYGFQGLRVAGRLPVVPPCRVFWADHVTITATIIWSLTYSNSWCLSLCVWRFAARDFSQHSWFLYCRSYQAFFNTSWAFIK